MKRVVFSAPKQVTTSQDQFLVSPITGEKIPADKVQEHVRIGEWLSSIQTNWYFSEYMYTGNLFLYRSYIRTFPI
jgi:hypothetical protein